MKYQNTLNAIYAELDSLGDLPIFSATVNRIQQVSSSRESDAMALAMAVMKDANLSAKLLKIANTPHYNRSHGKISVVSRAVVLIGFERIQNLSMTLKLIETFNAAQPETGIDRLLISAFLNAAMAREIAIRCGAQDVEQSYICGLLYRLGEIIVAFTLPARYRVMLAERAEGKDSWTKIQLRQLGGHFSDIGQDLTQSWGFPKTVVETMDPMTAEQLRPAHKLNHLLAAGSHDLLEMIYYRDTGRELDYTRRIKQISANTGLTQEQLEEAINASFRQVCDLSVDYGLNPHTLKPPFRGSGNSDLDELSRKLAFYISSRAEQFGVAEAAAPDTSQVVSQSQLQLDYLDKMNQLVGEAATSSKLVDTTIEAIERCSRLERVAFCLLSKDGKQLSARVTRGAGSEELSAALQLSLKEPLGQLFIRLVEQDSTLLVADCSEKGWVERLPADLGRILAPAGFVAAPLRVGSRPVGMFYADIRAGGAPLDDAAFRIFNQFLVQVRLALELNQRAGSKPN
ncbi:HDOD domain-containing protein [Marinobacterium lutimaris]|uniref:HDOD domain-containing protein n=1 Tax=Marinobacterium lutimaris TaxID=568106 RepID=A0A1H6AYP5_9GAMM|nr:HDOD domain-containing protein [Marinobacterium lutimaris]SEG53420.1 HDOD domain-containing protein [Marinobacterium lutimaris]